MGATCAVSYLRSASDLHLGVEQFSFPDFSVSDRDPDLCRFRMVLRAPIVSVENLSIGLIRQLVDNSLAGRNPMTYWSDRRRDLTSTFEVGEPSSETIRQVSEFAIAVTTSLEPLLRDRPTLYLQSIVNPMERIATL